MFWKRRGCLIGCGGFLLFCVVVSLFTAFVLFPRAKVGLEKEISNSLATEIATQVDSQYSQEELQRGASISVPLSTWSDEINNNPESDGTISLFMRGEQVVIRWELQQQSIELRFDPKATADGRLSLESSDGLGWFERQFSDVLGGGFEKAFNEWLDRNNLILVGVESDGENLLLKVKGA